MLPAWPPSEAPSEAIDDVMPMTRPPESTSAPPLLPGLTAASVWMASVTTRSACGCAWPGAPCGSCCCGSCCCGSCCCGSCCCGSCCCGSCCYGASAAVVTGRFSALTTPVVVVLDRPSGLPIAMTGSPTRTWEESANVAGTRSFGGCWMAITARSVAGSVPTIVALYVRPSASTTEMAAPALLPAATTWLLVSTRPAVSRTTPDPWPPPPSAVCTRTETTLGFTAAAVATQFGAVVLPLTSGALCCAVADDAGAALAGLPKASSAPTVPRLARTAAPQAMATPASQPGRDRSRLTVVGTGTPASVAGGVALSRTGVVMTLLGWASLLIQQAEPERSLRLDWESGAGLLNGPPARYGRPA